MAPNGQTEGMRGLLLLLLAVPVLAAPFLLEIPNIDFHKAYYPVGRQLLDHGTFQYTYDGFKNLPLVAYLLAPFAALGKTGAANNFLAAELLTYLATFVYCAKHLARSDRQLWLLLFLFASCRHFYTCLRLGQLTLLCFLLLMWMVAAYEKGRPRTAGVLCALAFVLKIPAGLFFLYFLYRRQLEVVISAILTYAAFLALSLLLLGWDLHRDYVGFVVLENAGATLTAYNNLGIAASLMRLLRRGHLFDWSMVELPIGIQLAAAGAIILLLIGFYRLTSGTHPRGGRFLQLEISMVTCLALVTLPIVWDHYYLFLILPFYYSFETLRQVRTRWALAQWAVALALANLPVLAVLEAAAGPTTSRISHLALVAFRATIPAAPLVGCLALLALLMLQYRAARAGGGPPVRS